MVLGRVEKNEEVWKAIKEYEGFYEISSFGRVRGIDRLVRYKKTGFRLKKGVIMKTGINKYGYERLGLRKNGSPSKQFTVHKLVATAFCENKNNYKEVNHIDGNKLNNHYTNLEWCSSSYNKKHAFMLGLQKPRAGIDSNLSKLSNEEVVFIYKAIHSKLYTAKELSEIFNVLSVQIYRIKNKQRWKHLTSKLDLIEFENQNKETLEIELKKIKSERRDGNLGSSNK